MHAHKCFYIVTIAKILEIGLQVDWNLNRKICAELTKKNTRITIKPNSLSNIGFYQRA